MLTCIRRTEDGGSLRFFWSNPLAKLALGTKATFESTSASFKINVDTAEKSSTRNLLLKSGEMFEATFTGDDGATSQLNKCSRGSHR